MEWSLKITIPQFKQIYKDTDILESINLFKRPPKDNEDLVKNYFPSKLWRLNSGMYKIQDKYGEVIPFNMTWAQHKTYAAFLTHPRLIILKSRQQGISTFWLLFFLDEATLKGNKNFGLMAQGLSESKKLKSRLIFAYESLNEDYKKSLNLDIDTNNSNEFKLTNNSTLYIATSFRSGTLQGLHISEYGKIARAKPERAKETKTGSLQAIRAGLPVVIESTAEGEDNEFAIMWNIAVDTLKTANLTEKDFYPLFLSWVDDPDCTSKYPKPIDKEAEAYFLDLEIQYEMHNARKLKLKPEQKWWWIGQFKELSFDKQLMGQEYPGYPEEAFESARDGAYYAKLFRQHVVANKQIVPDLYDPQLTVHCALDLGMNDTMSLIFYQVYRKELRIINEYHNEGEAIEHYVNYARKLPYKIAMFHLPHDANVKELGTGKSRIQIFRNLGCTCTLLPRTNSVNNDVELVRKTIPFMWFDEANTKFIRDTMLKYSKEWDEKNGVWKNKPKHNKWSHSADAIRYMVIAEYGKLVRSQESGKKRAPSFLRIPSGFAI